MDVTPQQQNPKRAPTARPASNGRSPVLAEVEADGVKGRTGQGGGRAQAAPKRAADELSDDEADAFFYC